MPTHSNFTADDLLGHAGWARNLARRLVADAATADDLVQEAWVSALQDGPSNDRPLRPWLERVIRNAAHNLRRDRSRRAEHEVLEAEQRPTAAPAVDDVVAKAEGQQRRVAAVLQLSEPYRSAVLLRYFEDLSAAEIGRRTQTPAGTVRWRLSEGLRMLREELDASESGDVRAWCAALLPVAGFASVEELAALSVASVGGASAPASFISILTGAFAMKLILAVGAVFVGFYLYTSTTLGVWSVTSEPAPVLMPSPVANAAESGDGAATDALRGAGNAAGLGRSAVAPSAESQADGPQAGGRSAAVSMRFVDIQGAAIRGVEVQLGALGRGVSDAQGQLRLNVVQPETRDGRRYDGQPLLVARRSGFATLRQRVSGAPLFTGATAQGSAATTLGRITLQPGAGLEGLVVDAAGQPVHGAEVRAVGAVVPTMRASNPLAAVAGQVISSEDASVTKTDAVGHFRLEGLPLGRVDVEVSFGDHQSNGDRVGGLEGGAVVQTSRQGGDLVKIVIKPRFTLDEILTVTVLSPEGKPVPWAQVSARHSQGQTGGFTDERGVTRFGVGHGVRKVDLYVSTNKGGYAQVVKADVAVGTKIELRFAVVQRLPIRVSSAAGRAIEGVQLSMSTVGKSGFLGFGGTRPVRLASGDYLCDEGGAVLEGPALPNVRFVLYCIAEGHAERELGPFDPAAFVVAGKATGKIAEFELDALPYVKGRVVDAGGTAVAGATVGLYRRPESQMTYNGFPVWLDPHPDVVATSAADGRFELTLRGDEPYFLRADAEGFATTESKERAVSGEDIVDVQLRLGPGGVIEGRVRGLDGRPAAGAIVAASRGDGFAQTVRADANGVYRFEQMTVGAYVVQRHSEELHAGGSSSSGGFGGPIRELGDPQCRLTEGQSVRVDLGGAAVLDADLAGRIALAGLDLAGRTLAIEPADLAEGAAIVDRWQTTLGPDGGFEFAALPSGAMLLRVIGASPLIEARVELVPGANRYELITETRVVELEDLPRSMDGGEVMVMARWIDGPTSLSFVVPVGDDGRSSMRFPLGTVLLERTPAPSDLAELMARGGYTNIRLREISVR